MTLVSVIIPFYNQPAFIGEAVRSVQNQTHLHTEIIVVDDGSPVPAESLLRDCTDVQIYRTKNQERCAARNFGVEVSSGEFLLFLDADDRLSPDALTSHLRCFEANAGAGLTFGAAQQIDQSGQVVGPAYVCRPRKNYFLLLLETNPIASTGAALFSRQAFFDAGRFDTAFNAAEDYQLYLRVARRHAIARHSTCVLDYRMHSENSSRDKPRMLKETLKVLDIFEKETQLSPAEKKRLERGRARWKHVFSTGKTFTYSFQTLLFRVHGVWDLEF